MAYNVCAVEPQVQYAKTSDGVSIAFWALGEGEVALRGFDEPVRLYEVGWEG